VCHLRLGNTTAALKDAETALSIEPTWYKGKRDRSSAVFLGKCSRCPHFRVDVTVSSWIFNRLSYLAKV
jgi:hypothetical protein